MILFLKLLPIYLLGNLHCAGMCGPFMMLLAKNPFKWAYFLGRGFVYAFAGLLAAEVGLFLFQLLAKTHFSAILSLSFGIAILALAFVPNPGGRWFSRATTPLLSKLLKFKGPSSLFLFGCATLLLPCGQTLLVFSACALEANPLVGLINGFLFALLTTPSLIFSMQALKGLRAWAPHLIKCFTLAIGVLAILRGLADFNLIAHLVLSHRFHIVLY